MRLFQVTIPEENSLEVHKLIQEDLDIPQVTKTHAGNLFVLTFRVQNDRTNAILGALQKQGVGKDYGYIDILPIETSIPLIRHKKAPNRGGVGFTDRLTVETIYSNACNNNNMTFDFLTFLIMAGLIAAAGLAGNSVVTVVAAMLVSPLMGPIIAFSLGVLIRDWDLVAKGLRNEVCSLCICVTLGFIYAFPFLPFSQALEWPTAEMDGRGQALNLVFGVLVASPSGIAVALSLTASNVAGLVGVAISASLLPPAVNAGMSFNYAIFGPLLFDDVDRTRMLINAGTSFSLTMVNIACINIFAMMFFKLKRIAPITTSSDIFAGFETIDVKPSEYHELYHQDLDTRVEHVMSELNANDALP